MHALLGLRTLADLHGHPAFGASWEGFVLEKLLVHLTPRWQTGFYRTAAGAELDLVAESRTRRIGFEIQYSSAPSVTRGFRSAIKDLDLERAFVLGPVAQAYPLADNVEVIPVSVQGFRTLSEVLDPKPV